MNKLKTLNVQTTQGYAGRLIRESQYIFNYRTEDTRCEISLTTPLTVQSYAANILPGVLRQNLPEGYLLGWIKENFGKTMKLDDFNMLALTAKETIGRVRCTQEELPLASQSKGESLQELLTWKGTEDLFEHLSEKYAATSGISGVQPKVLIPERRDVGAEVIEKASMKDRSLIVKAAGADYPGLAENEFHCMSIGQEAGLAVPAFWLSEDKGLFIVERFDLDGAGGYLGFEDMTALTGRQNDEKYQGSYEMAAKVVRAFASPANTHASLNELFASVVLSLVVRNGDAHLKNFGILYTHPQSSDAKLSPLYDIVNTTAYLPKDSMALKLNKTKTWPDRETLIEFGKAHCDVDRPAEVLDRIIDAAMSYQPQIEAGEIWPTMLAQIQKAAGSVQSSKLYAAQRTAPVADHMSNGPL